MSVSSTRLVAGAMVALALWAVLASLAGWQAWIGCVLAFLALATLYCVVARWQCIGPHGYYDLIRSARKGRTVLVRILFLVTLLAGLGYTYFKHPPDHQIAARQIQRMVRDGPDAGTPTAADLRESLAQFNAKCAFYWFLLQNIAILLLTPAYVGGAMAEERERGTLELLFASQLSSHEIILGKLVARLVHLGGLLLAGLPIFSMMLVWGGIDFSLLLVNWVNSVLLLIVVSGLCVAISTLPVSSRAAVSLSYVAVLGPTLCCAGNLSGIPLVIDETSGGGAWSLPAHLLARSVLAGGYFILASFFVALAICALRPIAGLHLPVRDRGWNDTPSGACVDVPLPPMLPLSAVVELADPGFLRRPLAPVTDNALYWKERYTGRRTLLHRPEVWVLGGTVLGLAVLFVLQETVTRIHVERPATWTATMQMATEMWGPALRVAYAASLACYAIGVAFRCGTSVAGERHLKTLDALLMIPAERYAILRAKWYGAIHKGRPWLILMVCNVLLGVAVGVYHPFSVCYLLFFPWALVVALASLGLLVSILVRTVLQANVVMAVAILGVVACVGLTQPERWLGYLGLGFTRWTEPSMLPNDLLVGGIIATVLLMAAFFFWSGAAILFERTVRR